MQETLPWEPGGRVYGHDLTTTGKLHPSIRSSTGGGARRLEIGKIR
eukprot:SAG11_NODE_27179_length_335_cov_6.563559_1_plen_45_part_10